MTAARAAKCMRISTLCCEVDELTAAMRCLDAGRPGDYLFRLPEFLQQRCCIDLYALAKATSLDGILAAVAGTRWEKVLGTAAERQAGPRSGTAEAEPLLQAFRHRALVALAPAKGGSKRCAEPARSRRAGMRHLRCFQRRAAHPRHRRAGLGGAHQRPPRLHGPDERRVGIPARRPRSGHVQGAVRQDEVRPAAGAP